MSSNSKKRFIQSRSVRFCALSISMILFLSACSDDNDNSITTEVPENDDVPGLAVTGLNDDPTGELTSPWLMTATLFRTLSETPATGDVDIELLEYPVDFRVAQHVNFYTSVLDTCEIRDLEGGQGGGNDDDRPLSVSGGTSLTINTASGTWLDIPSAGPGSYEIFNGFPGVLPPDATLSIPGDRFPNVPAYPLVAPVDVPERIAPAAGILTAADVAAPFTWVRTPNTPGGYVQIAALAFESDGSFVGFPVVCRVIDDGEFTLPADVAQAFADSTLDIRTRYERVLERVDYINNIVFHQRSVLAE